MYMSVLYDFDSLLISLIPTSNRDTKCNYQNLGDFLFLLMLMYLVAKQDYHHYQEKREI